MIFNQSKTVHIFSKTPGLETRFQPLMMNFKTVTKVSEHVQLRICLNESLFWEAHVNEMNKKNLPLSRHAKANAQVI